MLSVITLSVNMLSDITLSVNSLSVIMQNVVLLSAAVWYIAARYYAECDHTECRYADWCSAIMFRSHNIEPVTLIW